MTSELLKNILDDLDDGELSTFQWFLQQPNNVPDLPAVPKSRLQTTHRCNTVDVMVQTYGDQRAVQVTRVVLEKIHRNDLLQRFPASSSGPEVTVSDVGETSETREPSSSQTQPPLPQTEGTKWKHETDSRSANKKQKQKSADDELKSQKSDKENVIPPWRTTIKDLKITDDATKKFIIGKVVQKSGLRTYETKDQKKFFFFLAVADDTDIIKVMVYGKERFQQFKEENFYTFRDVLMEKSIMKVTKRSTISDTGRFDVPEDLDLKARLLLYSSRPVCSIAAAWSYGEWTLVSVEGYVTEIGPLEHVKLKTKRRSKARQGFKLEDKTGSIKISLWGEDTQQLRGKSAGDYVIVANVKTNHYYGTVSLNSTDYTRIVKVQGAAFQNVRIEIIGIINASRTDTELEAEINQQVQTLVVASSSLQKAFRVRLDGDFKERLLEKIPLSADAEIQGNKIIRIEAA